MKQVKKDSKNPRSVYFVEVPDHVSLRRNILQSLRDILDSLQKYHDFERLKEQKAKKIAELRAMVNRTNVLMLKLKDLLPHTHVPEPKKGKKEKATSEEQAAPAENKAAQKSPKQKSELDMLEDELASIERKLDRLV